MTDYEPLGGYSIERACEEACTLAKERNDEVQFKFNEHSFTVQPNDDPETHVKTFYKAIGQPYPPPPFHPQTAKDALDRWDKGEIISTIEMGGLGPGYEQAIQILIFEIIRDCHDKPLPEKDFGDWGETAISRADKTVGGFSGAQVGAARQVAYKAIKYGWEKMLETVPQDRKISVSRDFPQPPELLAGALVPAQSV